MCGYVSLQVHAHVNVDAYRDQRVHFPLELELQATASAPTWLLWTELPSSARAVHILNCQAISPPTPALFSSQSLSLNLELTDLARLTSQRAPRILLCPPPSTGITSVHPTPCFYVGVRGSKLMSSHQLYHGAISPAPGACLTAQSIHVDYCCAIPTHLQPC